MKDKKLALFVCATCLVAAFGLIACSGNEAANDTEADASADAATEEVAAEEPAGEAEADAETEAAVEEPAAAGDATVLTKEGADPSSIVAVEFHPEGTFTSENITQNATCMGCHDAETIIANGEGLLVDLDSGTIANPHSNHQYLDCTDCHNPTEQSVMYCNSCHEFQLAEGWANPELGAAEIGYEYDCSGMGLSFEDSGRNTGELPAEALDGYAMLEAMAAAQGMTAEEFKAAILQQMLGGM